MTYRYVVHGLVREEAQREGARLAASIVRMARVMRNFDTSQLTPVLHDALADAPKQIAWIRILRADGEIVAEGGRTNAAPKYSAEMLRSLLGPDATGPREQMTPSGPVFITLNLLPQHLLHGSPPRRIVPAAPEFIEIALYERGISVHFGPLREYLIVGVAAAFALIGAVTIMGLRFGNYVRGKQVEKELAIARRVQFDLFPNENSARGQIQFAAQCIPAWQVGGDLYDVFESDKGETALILGDVTGKGLPAALMMGVVQGIVRASGTMASALHHEQAAERLNQFLCLKTARERFVTLFWSYFNAEEGTLTYINAGHPSPLLIRRSTEKREILRLDSTGPVMGVLPSARYEQAEITVQADDVLVVYSDGIVEASDSRQQEFGQDRLIEAIESNWAKSPTEICEAILADVRVFLGQEQAQDDQTILVARLEPKRNTIRPTHFEAANVC
ncbi:MAG TPA: PP2C family protein-serine/threonine phosphatase [Bryobacteraceae bacterium]|jgi:hypothetical protein|nr:PP2C family protein-serine/threonine phosphatase [Bryobacteraceae bacterium]